MLILEKQLLERREVTARALSLETQYSVWSSQDMNTAV